MKHSRYAIGLVGLPALTAKHDVSTIYLGRYGIQTREIPWKYWIAGILWKGAVQIMQNTFNIVNQLQRSPTAIALVYHCTWNLPFQFIIHHLT
jgi:hypothetical protein